MANVSNQSEKTIYRVRNWSSYNQSLINRGNIRLWFDASVAELWYDQRPCEAGGQYVYSDFCIEAILMLRSVFSLSLRASEGFCQGLVDLMGLDLAVPSYTQLSRRAAGLSIDLSLPSDNRPIDLVVDSTGVKVYGEGEWKVRKHGYSKRRTWRKLHLGIDPLTGMCHAQVLTDNGVGSGDGQQLKDLLDQVNQPIKRVAGDGAYDSFEIWQMLEKRQIAGLIPPAENAVYWVDEEENLLNLERNDILACIDRSSRKEWKQSSGYHMRSMAENGMYRYKTLFGASLKSRKDKQQQIEAFINIKCMNKMTEMGMPISVKVA